MNHYGIVPENHDLTSLGLQHADNVFWNLTPADLVEETIANGMGQLSDTGALAVDTGEFTGRSPKDRFIVEDDITRDSVWWGDINIKFSPEKFDRLYNRMAAYLSNRDLYIRDAAICDDETYRMRLRVVTEYPWSNLFAYNMFQRLSHEEMIKNDPEWTIVCAPGFMAIPEVDGTRQHNFAILNFTRKMAIIGGTAYTGEIKKGIFSVLNFILPHQKNVLSMHCSANVGKDGDTAIFFGLSGTGKTTLSSDPHRGLIGDDEHGWSEDSVFNFEGGCYAKVINLSKEQEPQIYDAIKFGSLLENVGFKENSSEPDYADGSKTENTRVSYPIDYIDNAVKPSRGGTPKNIFFLTADAFGVLPPISKLTPAQASYHFISGYTAKVAGTEAGITEPVSAFSACFGAPFMPLHPGKYADMLSKKIRKHDVKVWLVNTGWSGGSYGEGSRIKLKYTRAMIHAALDGELDNVDYETHEVFGLAMPTTCPNVPSEILSPRNTWADKSAYDHKANVLAGKFVDNFKKFEDGVSEEIVNAAPRVQAKV
ncbi:MAG TPA: phosphoenolpyruvate carboxykinase (ATP) [Cryomorphaceae bacterium]|nr:phosphoenolpyruvate carboxykinase (ATP) [Cryomorphaceae bacterium]